MTDRSGGELNGSGGAQGMLDESIEFVPSSVLQLAPSQVTSIVVQVDPALRQSVTFEILTNTAAFDGFLTEAQVRVDESGKAAVKLQAPTQSGAFQLRASVSDSVKAVRTVSVSDQGYGSLKVTPKYIGKRAIDAWTASAHPNGTCENLESPWTDGALTATGKQSATIGNVPVGTTVALVLRGDELVSGCTTVTGLGADQLLEVEVVVTDRKIDTGDGRLQLELDIDSTAAGFATHLEETVELGVSAVQGENSSDAEVLLSRMKALLTEGELSEFIDTESEHDLATTIASVWTTEDPISSQVQTLLTQAATLIPRQSAFVGNLELQGTTSQFTLQSAAGVPAPESGFKVKSTWMVSAETGDTLVFGGTLSYEPLTWLAAIAESHEEASPAIQVQESGMCLDVADAIFMAVGEPYETCEQNCLEALCLNALESLWEEATSVTGSLVHLQVGITGTALLDGPAKVTALTDGTWVGRLEDGATSLKGAAWGSSL